MKRHYYSSESVDALEKLEIELERAGVDAEQIHVMSDNEALFRDRHLHMASFLSKRAVLRSGSIGFGIGLVASLVIFFISAQAGFTKEFTLAPAAFLSLAVLGFCTWEGGLWGIQKPSRDYARFQNMLEGGAHLMFVDVMPGQDKLVASVVASIRGISAEGKGDGEWALLTAVKKRLHKWVHWTPEMSTN